MNALSSLNEHTKNVDYDSTEIYVIAYSLCLKFDIVLLCQQWESNCSCAPTLPAQCHTGHADNSRGEIHAMDPVGGVASILTLLNAAAGTCELLHTLVLDIKDASRDIRAQNEKLHCLHMTITQLAAIYAKLPEESQRGAPWHRWIEDFAVEVAFIRDKVQRKVASIENASLGIRLQEGCRWILFDRQLRRFYESLEHWNIVFSQAVSVSQLYVSIPSI